MQTADEFLLETWLAVCGGEHTHDGDENSVPLLWGNAPEPDDDILEYHPDRPSEPVMWRHMPNYGGYVHGWVELIKKTFVEDCLAGRIKTIENPRQWLLDKLNGWFSVVVVT